MKRTKKPVHIHTSNKWSTCQDGGSSGVDVEMDRLTLRTDDDKSSKTSNAMDPVVHFTDPMSHEVDEEDDPEEVCNTTPDDYHEANRLFHLNFLRQSTNRQFTAYPKIYKNGTRKSLSFSNERMREIERTNQILLKKILSKGPRTQPKMMPNSLSQTSSETQSRVSSATVNRRKQQRQIDIDNELLRRKLLHISQRK